MTFNNNDIILMDKNNIFKKQQLYLASWLFHDID